MKNLLLSLSLLFALALPKTVFADESALWSAIREGRAVAMMRHALAPGTGDPANFALNDCATQRNLSAAGRDQARRIGERFRENGISKANVQTSQWCRCRETAELLALGEPDDLPAINSFFRNRASEPQQTQQVRAFIEARNDATPLVLVTHQVNITALTGVFPRSGEIVVFTVQNGEIEVLGSIRTDA